MQISFEHHDITTVSASLAKEARKRKHNDTGYECSDGASKRPKLEALTAYHENVDCVGLGSYAEGPGVKDSDSLPAHSTNVTPSKSKGMGSADTTRSSTPSTNCSTPRNKGGRPRTKPPISNPPTKNLKKATVLRVNRLVKAVLPMDIWLHVMRYCNIEFLLKMRSISRAFREALSTDSDTVWSQTLRRQFGSNLPAPPPGLSQMHYANLLTQHGCQSCRDEGKGSTRRTYWAFQRRFCEGCLDRNIVFVSALST